MNIWEILGIAPTEDEDMIKKAYLAKLPEYHPEEDPDGFRRLRQAMEEALEAARDMRREHEANDSSGSSSPMMGSEDVREFLKKAEDVYRDYQKRFSPDAWRVLLSLPVCRDLESQKEASLALLGFLMDHTYIPHSCYQVFNQVFGWTDEEEDLYQHFPKGYIDFLFDRIHSEDSFRYDCFEIREGFDYDRFCDIFFKLRMSMNSHDREAVEAAFRDLYAMDMDHPDLTLQRIRHEHMLGNHQKQAWMLAKELYAKDGENTPTRYWYIYSAMNYEDSGVDPEETGELILSLLKKDPESPDFWHLFGNHLRRQGDASQALFAYRKAKEYSHEEWDQLDQQITDTAEEVSREMEQDPQFDDWWQLANVCWMAHRYERVKDLLEKITPDEEQKMPWLFMMGGSCHELKDYKAAATYRQEIWDSILPENRAFSLYLDLAEDYENIGNPQKAEEIYIQAEEVFPGDPDILYRHARLLASDDRNKESISLCDKALESGFHQDSFHLRLENLLDLERYEEVCEETEDIIKKGYRSAQVLFYYAKALKALEKYQEAEQILKEIYERTNGAAIVCQEYAALCYRTGRSAEALEWIEKALEQDDSPILLYRKGEYLHDLKRYEEEAAIYRELIKEGADNFYIYYRTGRVLSSMRQFAAAEQYLRKSVETDPDRNMAWDILGDVLQNQGKWEDAAWAYEEGWKQGDRQAARDLCRLMKRTHQQERAGEYLDRALKQYPDDASLLWIRSTILKWQKKYEEAVRCLGRYMEVRPNQTCSALREIASIWEDAGDYQKAEEYYQKTIDHDPKISKNWRIFGKYYANTRKMQEKALPYLEKAAQLDPDSTYGWMKLGEVYEALGRKADADRCYEQSLKNYMLKLEKEPNDCCICEGIADVLIHLGRLDEAEEMAHRAVSLQNEVYTCNSQVCYEALEDLAKAEEKRGNLEKALEWMERAGQYSLTNFYPKEIARLKKAIEQA